MSLGVNLGIGLRNQLAFGDGVPFSNDISLLYQSFSNGYLIEKSGLNAEIVGYPACSFIQGNAGNTFAISDNGNLDIASTGEISLSVWVKTGTNITDAQYVLGKNIAGSINGRYGIYIASSKFSIIAQNNTASKTLSSTSSILANTWYHVCATFKNGANGELYINKVRQGSGVAIGTVSALPNANKFCLAGGTEITGATHGTCFGGKLVDARVFKRILSESEIESCYNRTIVGDETGYWPITEFGAVKYLYDVSGNSYHLTNIGITLLAGAWSYDALGSQYFKSNRFSIWDGDNKTIYVPFDKNGVALSLVNNTNIDDVVYKQIDSAITTFYNLAPFLIDFNPLDLVDVRLDVFDRSNILIHNDASRASISYDSLNPYRIASSEIFDIDILKTYFTDDYLWKVFPNVVGNSVQLYNRNYLKELLVYSTKKIEVEKLKILTYTRDIDKFYKLDYYWENNHISALRDSKILVCNDAGGIKLSLDNGATYGALLNVSSDLTIVDFAHIFENGNIVFCSHRKVFISTDNLATYRQVTVYDINGNVYTPPADAPYLTFGYSSANINGQEILTWGNYAINALLQYVDVNLWYSSDNGETIKSAYKFNITPPVLDARHIHGVCFNENDNSFWMSTGDVSTDEDECHWLKGVYNTITDTWVWTLIGSDDGGDNSFYKSVGFVFYNGYMYWGIDKTTPQRQGVWKCLYSDAGDSAKYIRVSNDAISLSFAGIGGEMIETSQGANKTVVTTIDGIKFKTQNLIGGVTLDATFPYICNNKGKGHHGYWCIDQMESGDTYPYFTQGQVLMVKLNKNN